MQYLRSLIVFTLSFFLLLSCTNSSAKNDNNADTSTGNGNDSAYNGKASLSYTIGDRHVAIKENLVTGGKNWIALFLNKVVNNPADGTVQINVTNYLSKEVFEFNIANKGSSGILHYSPSLAESKNKGIYMSPKYVNYNADDVTVTIADINATHVSGTFVGKFIEQDGRAVINITDGKFDLPFVDDKTNQ